MRNSYVYRAVALSVWAWGVWLLLTWTVMAEQLIFGALLALAIGFAFARLGPVVAPWQALSPRRLVGFVWLVLDGLRRIVVANLSLARRIWSPRRPLRSGMVVVATSMHTDAGLGWTGLISSLIVDNQIVDLDREHFRLQYHAVAVPDGGPLQKSEQINAPVERHLARIIGEHP